MNGTHGALQGVVAVDGPSGTGKSTTARGLATRLGARYLDTGAMYRAATLAVLRAEVPLDAAGTDADGHDDVAAIAVGARVEVSTDPEAPRVLLDGADVGAEIRGPAVTGAVSAVSALRRVREHLVAEQRRLVAETLADGGGIVVEGRDIGTVVTPDAPLKIYLTASEQVRADRRTADDAGRDRASTAPAGTAPADTAPAGTAPAGTAPAGTDTTHGTLSDLARRDHLDSTRATSPLQVAHDAVVVDTSTLGIDAVLTRLTALATERGLVSNRAESGANGG